MVKEFEGSTRIEAVRLADSWRSAQNGLTSVTRYIFPPATKATEGAPSKWKVLIHYESE